MSATLTKDELAQELAQLQRGLAELDANRHAFEGAIEFARKMIAKLEEQEKKPQ